MTNTLVKISFLFAFVMLFQLPSFAQVQLGFKVGVTNNTIQDNLEIGNFKAAKPINTLSYGLLLDIPVSNNFGFQPELNYVQRGFKVQEGIGLDVINIPLELGVKLVTKVHQINMPLLAKYEFGNERVKAYVVGGPELGYSVNGNFKTQAHVIVDITLVNEKLNFGNAGFVERFEVGATAGGGVAFNTGLGEVFFDARYYHGLTDLVELPIVDIPLKNRSFQFNVGYKFPLAGASY